MQNRKRGVYERFVKRGLDIVIALLGLIIFMPVFAVLAILIRIKLGNPVIFKQERPGLNGRIFNLYKFRSMTNERDKNGTLLPDAKRHTSFGYFLRSSSLDELPQFFNMIKGDISFIGPRPLLVRYLTRYNKRQRHRHDVRPGLTGWAQVNGRNTVAWEKKFEYDLYYVENISFFLDVKIFLMTIVKVVKREGISPETSATMEEFMGNDTRRESA